MESWRRTDRSARIFAPFSRVYVPVNVVNISGGGAGCLGQMAKWDPKKDDHKIGLVNLPMYCLPDPKMTNRCRF